MSYRRQRAPQMTSVMYIIVTNVIFFIASLAIEDLFYYMGMIPTLFAERPWTILTAMFMHGSFGHLAGNMIVLYFFGRYIAMLLGQKRFLLLYFIGGLVGNAVYLWLGEPMSILIGASGATFALGGLLAVMRPKLRVYVYFIIPMPLWVAVIIGFLILSFVPGVAWQAHLGGLVVGLLAGIYYRRKERKIIIFQ